MMYDRVDYTIQLPVFEGPLDLLLRLIEREELDITEVALAQVTDQYLEHVRAIEDPDPAALSAFLVIAARLLVIKSRALLPRPASSADEPISDGEALVRQLQEYQRFKQAALLLRAWEEQGRRTYTRVATPPLPVAPRPAALDATLSDMIAAVQRRMQLLLPLEPPETPLPAPKIITVQEMAERIRDRLRVSEWFSFEDLLSTTVTRVEIVVALWSVLELLKRRAVVVEQAELFGPIMIGRGPNLSDAALHELSSETVAS
ncbi:MAG: ScpA family protein [Chloroflexota bacterium]|nr:MAG: chromosome segregation protein ScpA [Chloroflexota bacterium]